MQQDHAPESGLDAAALDYLRAAGHEFTYPDGTAIVRRGDPPDAFYVLIAGSLDVVLSPDDGHRLLLAQLAPLSTFGAMSILTGKPISADVVANGPAAVLIYPGQRLRTALTECPSLRNHVLETLINDLRRTTADVWNFSQRSEALGGLVSKLAPDGPIIAASSPMQALQKRIADLANTPGPVLITGELGTGKLFLARKIHAAAAKPNAPFITLSCSQLAPGEAARLIFGSAAAGDFTKHSSADALQLLGALHLADQGTLVLHHVELLEPPAQEALARYLQTQAVNHPIFPRTRIIATTREDLLALVNAGRFHQPLQQLLSARKLDMPRLRDRKRDILPLARLFLDEINQREKGPTRRFAESAERALVSVQYRHHNVIELREAVESASIFAEGAEIRAEHVFTGPKDQGAFVELDLAQLPLVSRLVRGRIIPVARAAVFAIFLTIMVFCLAAPNTLPGRIANALTWGLWWPGLMLLFLFIGRVWCIVCPISAAGRAVRPLARSQQPPPAWLRKHTGYAMAAFLVLIIWSEHVFDMPRHPVATGILLLSLMAAAAAFCFLYEREVWCRYLCPLGGLSAQYALPAIVHVRANPNVCAAQCTTHPCFKGSPSSPGCPVFHHPLYAREGQVCKLCLSCVRVCPHGSAKLYLRPPLWSVWGLTDLGADLVPFGLVAFFLSIIMLGANGSAWTASAIGFTAMLALAIAGAVALHSLLPRMLSRDPDPDPALAARVSFAMMLLAWGPLMAFHLRNVPGLAQVRIHPAAGSFLAGYLGNAQLTLLAATQLLAIAVAAVLALITFLRLRFAHLQKPGQSLPPGWHALVAVCIVYVLTAISLTLYWGIHP